MLTGTVSLNIDSDHEAANRFFIKRHDVGRSCYLPQLHEWKEENLSQIGFLSTK